MDQFEYVMALVSVVVGLGLTHILSALGAGVHRLRGHGAPIKLEPIYLLWVLASRFCLCRSGGGNSNCSKQ